MSKPPSRIVSRLPEYMEKELRRLAQRLVLAEMLLLLYLYYEQDWQQFPELFSEAVQDTLIAHKLTIVVYPDRLMLTHRGRWLADLLEFVWPARPGPKARASLADKPKRRPQLRLVKPSR